MKNNIKTVVAFVLAMGLASGVAPAETSQNVAGNALVGALMGAAGQGGGGDWVTGNRLYASFDNAALRHADSAADRVAGIVTAAGEPSIDERREVARLASAVIASNGAMLTDPAGANLGRTTFYDRGIPMTLEQYIWVCNTDAFKALANLVSIYSKEQGFNLYEYLAKNGFDDKAAQKYLLNLAFENKSNQTLAANMLTEKVSVADFAESFIKQIPDDADFKAEVPEEGIKIVKSLAEVYKGLTIEGKPSVPSFDTKEECCKDVPK